MSLLVDNRELALAFRRGERSAMETVYRHYLPLVAEIVTRGFSFGAAGQRLRFRGASSRCAADDLIAEVFMRAFRERARLAYDGVRPYSGYLKTIARNTVIERLRKKDPLSEDLVVPLDEGAADLEDAPKLDGPEQTQELGELVEIARVFIAGLPARERGVLEHRFVQGMPQGETAQVLGLSAPTVRKLERRLVHLFIQHMQARGYYEGLSPAALQRRATSAIFLALVAGHVL